MILFDWFQQNGGFIYNSIIRKKNPKTGIYGMYTTKNITPIVIKSTQIRNICTIREEGKSLITIPLILDVKDK